MVEVWAEWQQQLETVRSPYLVMMAYFQAGAGNLHERLTAGLPMEGGG